MAVSGDKDLPTLFVNVCTKIPVQKLVPSIDIPVRSL